MSMASSFSADSSFTAGADEITSIMLIFSLFGLLKAGYSSITAITTIINMYFFFIFTPSLSLYLILYHKYRQTGGLENTIRLKNNGRLTPSVILLVMNV